MQDSTSICIYHTCKSKKESLLFASCLYGSFFSFLLFVWFCMYVSRSYYKCMYSPGVMSLCNDVCMYEAIYLHHRSSTYLSIDPSHPSYLDPLQHTFPRTPPFHSFSTFAPGLYVCMYVCLFVCRFASFYLLVP